MPVVEIVSFTASKAFLSGASAAVLNKAIDTVKNIEGCLSVYRGFQLEDGTRVYIIITWASANSIATAKENDHTAFNNELKKSGLSLNDLSVQLFELGDDPVPSLDAPFFELRYTTPTQGHTGADLKSLVSTFWAQVKNGEYAELEFSELPVYFLGFPKGNIGSDVYLLGWKSLESREFLLYQSRPFVKFMEKVHELTHLDIKSLSVTKALGTRQ